jgi:hypothetical protein
LAIAGFLEIFFRLEGSPHDASAASAAVPLGRLSIDALNAQANVKHGSHLLTLPLNTLQKALSNEFRHVMSLVAEEADATIGLR